MCSVHANASPPLCSPHRKPIESDQEEDSEAIVTVRHLSLMLISVSTAGSHDPCTCTGSDNLARSSSCLQLLGVVGAAVTTGEFANFTMSTSGEKIAASSSSVVRVYNRRSKMGSTSEGKADSRDWASLPPTVLDMVFGKLELTDLKSAQETCRNWGQVVGDAAMSWTHTIDTILHLLHHLNQEMDPEVDAMKAFLVREGIMKPDDL